MMVNAMMYVRPQSRDFDDKWPEGWKWKDVSKADESLYERDPGQNYGSMDGLRYNNEAFDVLSKFFGKMVGNRQTSSRGITMPGTMYMVSRLG